MKLIIEIPESVYEAYKVWHKNKVATVEQSLIANSKPYEERPQGEWIVKSSGTTNYFVCNKCGSAGDIQDKYCRECGLKMRGGKEE